MPDGITRRDVLRRSGAASLAAPAWLLGGATRASAEHADASAPDVYGAIGVRPLINARGTFTILSGSTMLPEVRAAMDAAARRYVHLDELAEAVGARLAELTGAEWGLVSSGCAAALTHATAACVAGGNPDLHIRIPDLTGFAKDEVVIPKHSRNVYDAAVRAVGVRVTEVTTPEELEAALGPRTAMIYVLAGPAADESALPLAAIARAAAPRGVPILVDAAAEILTIPNVHLRQGATLVGYSGGKCLRGPQTAGLLLGRKDLVRAAWVHSAPHHGFARGLKVGKEEAIAMLAAVEQWVRRDHDAEWARWTGWLEHIASRLASIGGVETEIVQPAGLSNKTPSLRVTWDRTRLPLTGADVSRTLFTTEPRIAMSPTRGGRDANRTGVSVTPYMLAPGDERTIADRLHAILSSPPPAAAPEPAPAADVSGRWDVEIAFAAGRATHVLHLRQSGADVAGSHQGDFVARDLAGSVAGDQVWLRSHRGEEHGDALSFVFTGTIAGDAMSGALDMGEYLSATWRATRRGGDRV